MSENVMLAHPYTKKRMKNWPEDSIIVQPKINGLRCHALRRKGDRFRLFSRQYNEFTQLPLINAALDNMASDTDRPLHFDGELYVHGMPLQDIRTICKRTATLHPDHDQMDYHIFDLIPNSDEQSTTQFARLPAINSNLPWPHNQDRQRIHIVKSFIESPADLDELLTSYLAEGYEGIMLRNPNATYEYARTWNLLKLKPRAKGSFPILYVNEAIDIYGMPKDTLGSVTLQLASSKTFHCGAGQLTHSQRQFLWDHRDQLIGKTAHIIYQELSTAGIPQQPVLQHIAGVEYEY